jgi:NarL family two-component system response regulator LiaR
MDEITILIADDHPIVREGLRTLLSSQRGLKLVGEAVDGIEAVSMAQSLKPDIILMDLVMPRKDGIQAIREIKKTTPGARILILTSFAEDDRVLSAFKAGAIGYVLKDSLPQELLKAIQNVYRGEPSLSSPVTLKLLHELSGELGNEDVIEEELTEREIEVLKLVAQGLSNQEIADQLSLSEWTIRSRVSTILEKLQLTNRTQAALYAIKKGIVDVS